MDHTSSRPVGAAQFNNVQRRPTYATQRRHRTVFECTYKAMWHPFQKRIKVASHLNNCLLPRLDEIVKFKDPAGNVHKVAVNIHDGRQWFENGLLKMMQFYELDSQVQILYKYTDNNYFELQIWRAHGGGEIQYPQPVQVDKNIKEEPQEIIDIEDDQDQVPSAAAKILWKIVLTKAQEEGRQDLVLPVNIVTKFLHEDQKVFPVKVPTGEVRLWVLLWNTKIAKHCHLGQGWYKFCRRARLKADDELCF
ncbi:DNA-binding barrel domain superfamily [Sesbania bispinosa]|nr:DNA-binding barrel domain superfamily [Sesbania bispinosa]